MHYICVTRDMQLNLNSNYDIFKSVIYLKNYFSHLFKVSFKPPLLPPMARVFRTVQAETQEKLPTESSFW